MSFHDVRLPHFIDLFAIGAPTFSTSTAITYSGREIRNSDRTESLLKFYIKNAKLSETQFYQFNSFFKARGGKRFSFRFRDRSDFKAVKTNIAIGDGFSKEFQLYKTYEDKIKPYKRRIIKPVESTIQLYINNQEVKAIIDHLQGIAHFSAPPIKGDIISGSFEFDVPVRFSDDSFEYKHASDGSIELKKIELIEVYE